MHEQVVAGVSLQTLVVADAGCHRNSRYTCVTDQRVQPLALRQDEVEDLLAEDELESIDEPAEEAPLIELSPEPAKSSVTSYDKYIVSGLNKLESGKYYIQIAVYSADDNILEVIEKYGTNYPITIVPMSGSERKQILIGPLTMDEYKVVLERFKSYGFKDAFLRKVR